MPIDVKIKEERPQTPSDESQSRSPESCITSGASVVKSTQNNVISTATVVPPISPEGQSASSNEITSSTSPVPATSTTFDKHNESTIHSPNTGKQFFPSKIQ